MSVHWHKFADAPAAAELLAPGFSGPEGMDRAGARLYLAALLARRKTGVTVLGDRLEENFRLALTMSGGSYATFADKASLIVLVSAGGILLAVQAFAWAFGYRKSIADEAERA